MADIPSNTITVTNGTLTPYITSTVVSTTEITYTTVVGNTLTITANYIPGKRFTKWTSTSLTFTDETAETTTVTPPSLEGSIYSITATYTDLNYLDKDGLTTLVANIKNELATRDSQITALQNENAELLDQIPTGEATGELINLQDSSNLPIKDFAMLGNATQETTSISGGDEYDSPSPDHPQDIHVVTGDNTLKVVGKNLFNKNTITERSYVLEDGTLQTGTSYEYNTSDFIPVVPNTTYYKTLTLSPRTKFYNANKQVLDSSTYQDIAIGGNAGSFTTPNNAYYLRFTINTNVSTGVSLDSVMMHKGSTATTYEPYTEQTQLLSLGSIELAKIGDYTDKLFHAVAGNTIYESLDSTTKASLTSGKWYKLGEIKKVVVNGSESGWIAIQMTNCIGYYRAFENVLLPSSPQTVGKGMTNYFSITTPATNWATSVGNPNFCINNSGNNIRFTFGETTNDLEGFKNWLSTHNVTLYYAVATPEITEITDETLIARLNEWEAKATYKNITNMWLEPSGTNATPSMVVVYRKDLQTLTDKISNLEARVSLLE